MIIEGFATLMQCLTETETVGRSIRVKLQKLPGMGSYDEMKRFLVPFEEWSLCGLLDLLKAMGKVTMLPLPKLGRDEE